MPSPPNAPWVSHGLIDASVTVTGYRESSLDAPDLAQRALAELWAEFGVVGVRDVGSSVTANLRQRELSRGSSEQTPGPSSRPGPEPHGTHVHHTGLVLVEGTPLGDGDVVLSETALDAALGIATAFDPDAPTLMFKTESAACLAYWAGQARKRHPNARISARGATAVDVAVSAGLHVVDSFPWLAVARLGASGPSMSTSNLTPVEVLQAWARADERAIAARVAWLAEHNVALTSEFLALRRSVFIKEALTAAHLDRIEAILPHVRHVADMRRAGGYLSGRRSLSKFAGIEQPKSQQLAEAEVGWQKMLAAAAHAVDAGLRLLPASRSPLLTSCPGYSLLEELAVLVHAGIPAETVFDLAGSEAAEVLSLPLSTAPVLTADSAPTDPSQILRLRATDSRITAGL
ncbi:hypothetical protein HD598_001311 [Neomicrococcus aestuarii]|uniref:Uncharacterized protein n=1 Tax=Neomicrococcus aestuarii TaxID=556325 RepID=A0A7W8TTL6_9MICC|nr:hypothetical protein [Neomicrococcus aestuarii]MBB5512624.1 hypothetical protein [Neomicrococcus aestuarii]